MPNIYQPRNGSCRVKSCGLPILAKGLCSKHYDRQRRTGSTSKLATRITSEEVLLFLKQLQKNSPDSSELTLDDAINATDAFQDAYRENDIMFTHWRDGKVEAWYQNRVLTWVWDFER